MLRVSEELDSAFTSIKGFKVFSVTTVVIQIAIKRRYDLFKITHNELKNVIIRKQLHYVK